jgi:hypothetical protein
MVISTGHTLQSSYPMVFLRSGFTTFSDYLPPVLHYQSYSHRTAKVTGQGYMEPSQTLRVVVDTAGLGRQGLRGHLGNHPEGERPHRRGLCSTPPLGDANSRFFFGRDGTFIALGSACRGPGPCAASYYPRLLK